MRLLPFVLCFMVILHSSYAPPVSENKSKEHDSEVKDDLEGYMEYHRYLKEVVQALESDPDFRERLEKADEEEVRSGKIAEHLDFVNHNVRSKLDEIKRREMDRLRHLATKQFELTNNLDDTGKVPSNEHLDHGNPHTFEIEDLKKLIKKTTADLEVADKQRKEEFKEYEMQKEFEKTQRLETMDETQKKEFLETVKKEEEAKNHHQPLHHPGSKQQLEEVWEKQDHMDQQFDPKAFFMMHDVDGNGVWDADEVKALFIKELDKLYGPGGPNKDMRERAEEMERMREHVFRENDRNQDGLIDFNEFMLETQKADFNKDEGWKSIDENQIYTQQEYDEFHRRRLEEIKYLQERGLVDAHGRPVPGAQHQINLAYAELERLRRAQDLHHGSNDPRGYHPQAPQYQQVPQGYPAQGHYQPPPQGQYPPQGQFQAQHPSQQQYYGQPQGQYQAPQGQYQVPQGQQQAQYQAPQGQQPQYQGQAQPGQAQYPAQGQPAPVQYQAQPGQGQPAQGQFQAQGQPAQAQYPAQGQPGQAQYQAPPAQVQAQQPAQNVNLNQGQAPPAQAPPAQQVPVQNQAQSQGNAPPAAGQNQAQAAPPAPEVVKH